MDAILKIQETKRYVLLNFIFFSILNVCNFPIIY